MLRIASSSLADAGCCEAVQNAAVAVAHGDEGDAAGVGGRCASVGGGGEWFQDDEQVLGGEGADAALGPLDQEHAGGGLLLQCELGD